MHLVQKSLFATVLTDGCAPIVAALCLFGAPACSDGVLNSGADLGSPIIDSEIAADTTSSAASCGKYGTTIDGSDICWYVGPPFQSCTETCASLGGVHKNTASFIGPPEQGGSAEECGTILQALQYFGFVRSIPAPTGKGLGCYIFMDGYRYWIEDLNYDPDQKDYGTSLICGCNN